MHQQMHLRKVGRYNQSKIPADGQLVKPLVKIYNRCPFASILYRVAQIQR